MLMLVGLGNPGAEYAHNRHNIGFMAVEAITRRHRFGPWRKRFQAQCCDGSVPAQGRDEVRVLALLPQTFMNLSGQAVGEALRFFKLAADAVLVFHDDLDLAPGRVRIKRGGGHGGHNGLRSLDDHIGKEYWRIRLGIGHPGHKDLVHGHVLHDFAKADRIWLDPLLDALAAELPLLAAGQTDRYLNRITTLTAAAAKG